MCNKKDIVINNMNLDSSAHELHILNDQIYFIDDEYIVCESVGCNFVQSSSISMILCEACARFVCINCRNNEEQFIIDDLGRPTCRPCVTSNQDALIHPL